MSNQDRVLEKIKSKGYWFVNIRPTEFIPNTIKNLSDCQKIIEDNQVRFRGWSYPVLPRESCDDFGVINKKNYIETWIDVEGRKEIWRFYQSTQFVHLFALEEDWLQDNSLNPPYLKAIEPKTILGVTETLFFITEVFEFVSRLFFKNVFSKEIDVELILFNNTNNRKLKNLDLKKAGLFSDYISNEDKIRYVQSFNKDIFLLNSKDLALDTVIYFFNKFSWLNPSREFLKDDQEKLIKRDF